MMYKRLATLLIAVLEPLANYPEDLKKVGLTPEDIRIAIRVIEVILAMTKPSLTVELGEQEVTAPVTFEGGEGI